MEDTDPLAGPGPLRAAARFGRRHRGVGGRALLVRRRHPRRGCTAPSTAASPGTAVQLGCALAGRLFGAEIRVRAGVEVPVPLAAPPVDCDLIVPVPSSGRGRSCNVPALLGMPLAHALGIPLDETALRRTRKGRAQAGLTREERLVNAAGLFRADPDRAAGRRVLLVDDVITTGATAAACARALTAAGAEWVAVAGLAASRQNQSLPARPGQPFDLD